MNDRPTTPEPEQIVFHVEPPRLDTPEQRERLAKHLRWLLIKHRLRMPKSSVELILEHEADSPSVVEDRREP